MKVIALDSIWQEYIDQEWMDAIDQTPIIQRCIQGTVSRQELYCFTLQHYHYAKGFTRYLCALISNLPDDQDRYLLAENLFEEMGLGDLGEVPHSTIFRDMLTAFHISPEDLPPFAQTVQLSTAMMDHCSNTNPLIGLGALCLGAEAIVPYIYSRILKGFLDQGIDPELLTFYSIHIAGDEDHAITMKQIIDREVKRQPEHKQVLRDAAKHLIYKRVAMLSSITELSAANFGPSVDRYRVTAVRSAQHAL